MALLFTRSLSHAILTAKCRLRVETEWLFIIDTQAWLSSYIVVGAAQSALSSLSRPRSHNTSFAASLAATNSASAVERHTMDVHLDTQEIRQPDRKIAYPYRERLSGSFAKATSTYAEMLIARLWTR